MIPNYLDILAETIRDKWDKPALSDFFLTEDRRFQDMSRGKAYTYGEMYAEIVRVADLLTRLGLQKGDYMAICGANSAHWVIAYLAIAKMQGVSVVVMHSLQSDEIVHLIDFSDAKVLFVERELWTNLREQSLPQIQSVIALADWNILRGERIKINNQLQIANDQCQFVHGELDELAMICFTSGTTKRPRGVMLPFRSLNNNCYNNFILLQDAVIDAKAEFLSLLPFAHMYGLIDNLLPHLISGRKINILQIISVQEILSAISHIHPYGIAVTPFLLKSLLNKEASFNSLKQLKYIEIGGASLEQAEEQVLRENNVRYLVGYGLTETGPHITTDHYYHVRYASVGKIVQGMTACIAPNGEILVKGENVMLGYYKDPEATAQKIDKDGWLHTGDKGHLDEEGYLYVEGRLEQDIIVLPNGENIRPDNIEALINALPEVKESIVFSRGGELYAIIVSLALISKESIFRAINPQLPFYSKLYDVKIIKTPLERTEKHTLKRYLYT